MPYGHKHMNISIFSSQIIIDIEVISTSFFLSLSVKHSLSWAIKSKVTKGELRTHLHLFIPFVKILNAF